MGGNLRLSVRQQLAKYDVDGSGELERNECRAAFSKLLNGIADDVITELVDHIDVDQSDTLSVDEITAYLVAAQEARDPQGTSLHGSHKKH